MKPGYPIPENEFDRLIDLAEFDLDYSTLQDRFKDLTTLAAKVTGTDISLINLIDSYTLWTIGSHGLDVSFMPREDAVCQYTILEDDSFEVKDMRNDERFAHQPYVTDDPGLRYYFGIPLKSGRGNSLGTLCVFDKKSKELEPEKIELLRIIAAEIVSRLNTVREIRYLKQHASELNESRKRVAHDIRGPLGGIMAMAQLVIASGDSIKLKEILDFIELIQMSSKSLLELADDILVQDDKWKSQNKPSEEVFHQVKLKDTLEKLYAPQALMKGVHFSVATEASTELMPFSRNKILQIVGNLISNAIKFTPQTGRVEVSTRLTMEGSHNMLRLTVQDTGVGMNEEKVNHILKGQGQSSQGTNGESGYGFGLPLVKHLVDTLNGSLSIRSTPENGTRFDISLSQPRTN